MVSTRASVRDLVAALVVDLVRQAPAIAAGSALTSTGLTVPTVSRAVVTAAAAAGGGGAASDRLVPLVQVTSVDAVAYRRAVANAARDLGCAGDADGGGAKAGGGTSSLYRLLATGCGSVS